MLFIWSVSRFISYTFYSTLLNSFVLFSTIWLCSFQLYCIPFKRASQMVGPFLNLFMFYIIIFYYLEKMMLHISLKKNLCLFLLNIIDEYIGIDFGINRLEEIRQGNSSQPLKLSDLEAPKPSSVLGLGRPRLAPWLASRPNSVLGLEQLRPSSVFGLSRAKLSAWP